MQKITRILNRLLQILRVKLMLVEKPASAPECQALSKTPKATPRVRKPRSKVGTAVKNKEKTVATKPGLYANIHAKKARIAAGSGEKMRKPGTAGAPTAKAFKESAKTAKPAKKGK
jgi:hypothetical protein